MKKNLFSLTALSLTLSLVVFISACDDYISGSGNIIQEELDVKAFDAIQASGSFKVYLSQDEVHSLTIEADDNLLKYVEAKVSNGKLYLGTRSIGVRNATLIAYVTAPALNEITASGAASIIGEAPIDFNRLTIETSGASKIDLELYGNDLELRTSGAAKAELFGETEKASFRLSGASKLDAGRFYCKLADIRISGAGKATINVEDDLDARISGAGSVNYYGNPNVHQRVSGAGKISKIK